ncbi:hypothetical protein FB565_003321 [Actinoplanes lutulentus]|uniref:Uncharacterized protein n=1 Tax=Actinoplanes lutulentus TaxID=1287878 RepID=A0A327Z8J7_9ACTN|nr:hypothetical protein [Actinoplanes lutulentus]MBB2943592.1 hypothetical protein [Actinoplanes lutulentus]RAK27457.1 hypothetical protein B0I29_12391 [Actinoplanes lutulentus]
MQELIESASSGPWGIIVGAAFGVVASVLFEDRLLRIRQGTARRARVLRSRIRRTLPEQADLFTLGPLRTSVRIIEGDGTQVIDEQRIRVMVTHRPVEVPDEIRPWIDEVAALQEVRRQRGEPAFWNGPRYAVDGLSIGRSPLSEQPEICLRVRESDYFTFLATQQLDRPLPGGGTLRGRYVDGHDAPVFLRNSFGANAALITADDQLIFGRRSADVGTRPGAWGPSAAEALSRNLDSDGRSAPELYRLMRRGILEELALEPDEYLLEMLSFFIDTELQQWGSAFVGSLRSVTAEELLARRSRGAPDKWESEELRMVPFQIGPVLRFIADGHRTGDLVPALPVVAYMALVHRFGRRAVERAAAKLLRNG